MGAGVRQNLDQMSVSQHQELQCKEISFIPSCHCKIWREFVLDLPVFVGKVRVHLTREMPTFCLSMWQRKH